MAHVVAGRIALAKGHAPSDVDAALASFERVPRLFPNDEAVPAAGFYAGDTLRVVRRTDEALERFRRVSMEYPRSSWAARARIGAGLCLVAGDRAPRALEEFQRVRVQLPESLEGAEALNLNTICIACTCARPRSRPTRSPENFRAPRTRSSRHSRDSFRCLRRAAARPQARRVHLRFTGKAGAHGLDRRAVDILSRRARASDPGAEGHARRRGAAR